jgi:hypothetical protein
MISEDDVVGRRVIAVDLDNVPDGFAILTFDDGSALEIRTSKVGQLLLSSVEDAGLRP